MKLIICRKLSPSNVPYTESQFSKLNISYVGGYSVGYEAIRMLAHYYSVTP